MFSTCVICESPFAMPNQSRRETCSRRCAARLIAERRGTGRGSYERPCRVCGKLFVASGSTRRRSKHSGQHCSTTCSDVTRGRKKIGRVFRNIRKKFGMCFADVVRSLHHDQGMNISQMSRKLGVGRNYVHHWMERCGIAQREYDHSKTMRVWWDSLTEEERRRHMK